MILLVLDLQLLGHVPARLEQIPQVDLRVILGDLEGVAVDVDNKLDRFLPSPFEGEGVHPDNLSPRLLQDSRILDDLAQLQLDGSILRFQDFFGDGLKSANYRIYHNATIFRHLIFLLLALRGLFH